MGNGQPITQARVLNWLMAAVAVGFTAWAGVLWTKAETIIANQHAILVGQAELRAEQVAFRRDLAMLGRDVEKHESEQWHDTAGRSLQRLEATLDGHRRSSAAEIRQLGARVANHQQWLQKLSVRLNRITDFDAEE